MIHSLRNTHLENNETAMPTILSNSTILSNQKPDNDFFLAPKYNWFCQLLSSTERKRQNNLKLLLKKVVVRFHSSCLGGRQWHPLTSAAPASNFSPHSTFCSQLGSQIFFLLAPQHLILTKFPISIQ